MADQDDEARLRRALAAGAVLVTVLGVVVGWLGNTVYRDHESERNREILLAAARQCAASLTSIDYTRVESDVQRILDCSTGNFRVEFDGRSDTLIDVVKRSQSTSAGTVTAAGLESVNGS
ncbi:MAG: Mce protein, partial [Mycobacterium sp.]|nr:Mce protein [Mycobacterium sp.]